MGCCPTKFQISAVWKCHLIVGSEEGSELGVGSYHDGVVHETV